MKLATLLDIISQERLEKIRRNGLATKHQQTEERDNRTAHKICCATLHYHNAAK